MVTNLETKNDFERDEIRNDLDWLEQEVKINKVIDKTFEKFQMNLMTGSKANYELRSERNLSMEKMKNEKLRVKSYGETCEVDLRTWKISYLKWNTVVSLDEIGSKPILLKDSKEFHMNEGTLNIAFGQMNVINRAISMSKKSGKKDFYFEDWSFLQRLNSMDATRYDRNESFLKVDWKNIISIWWLKKRFHESDIYEISDLSKGESQEQEDKKFKNKFSNMLNRIILL